MSYTFYAMKATLFLMAVLVAPVMGEDEDMVNFIGGVFRPKWAVVLDKDTAVTSRGIVTRDRDVYSTSSGAYSQDRDVYATPEGAVSKPGDTFVGRSGTVYKTGNAFFGSGRGIYVPSP
jgi:hypothetical protein